MAYKLNILWDNGQESVDVKYEKLKGDGRKVNGKEIEMQNSGSPLLVSRMSGTEVKRVMTPTLLDTDGNIVNLTADVEKFYRTIEGEEIPVGSFPRTEALNITKFEPLAYYTDRYVIDSYYQIIPSAGISKKDHAKSMAKYANTIKLKKLWDYLYSNNVVGKGEFNLKESSLNGFAFVRAIKVNGTKWTLEIGRYKQQKIFTWIEELDVRKPDVQATPNMVTANALPNVDEI